MTTTQIRTGQRRAKVFQQPDHSAVSAHIADCIRKRGQRGEDGQSGVVREVVIQEPAAPQVDVGEITQMITNLVGVVGSVSERLATLENEHAQFVADSQSADNALGARIDGVSKRVDEMPTPLVPKLDAPAVDVDGDEIKQDITNLTGAMAQAIKGLDERVSSVELRLSAMPRELASIQHERRRQRAWGDNQQ